MKKILVAIVMALTGHLLMADALQDALNNQTLVFTTGGDAAWFAQSETTYQGAQTAQSGAIGDSQSTWLKTSVSGVGILSFKWKVSSESVNYDYVTISIDGEEKSRIGGTGGSWTTYSVDVLTEGTHELTWTYSKDGSATSGSDCAWVTDVSWTPISGSVTVSFDACGGVLDADPQTYSVGDVYGELPTPTREDCMFSGWYTQTSGGDRVVEGDAVRFSAPTLYAHWLNTQKCDKILDPKGKLSSIEFTDIGMWSIENGYVRWQMGADNQGERVDVLTATFSTDREGLLKFSNNGYGIGVEIDGEYAEEIYTSEGYQYAIPDAGEHTLTLYFDYPSSGFYSCIKGITIQEAPDSFSVTFNTIGGTCDETKRTYLRGDTYGELPTPTLAGCSFEGWSTSSWSDEFVSADDVASFATSTLYARWQVDSAAKFLGEDTGITFTTLTNERWSVEMESVWDYSQQKTIYKPYLQWYSPSAIKGDTETIILEATVQGAGTLKIPTTLSGNMNLTLSINGVVQTNYYVNGSGSYGESRVYVGRYYGNNIPTELNQTFLTKGGHRIKLALHATADSGTQYSYQHGSVEIGAMSWKAAPSSVDVAFDANGGSVGTSSKTYSTGGTYGSLPTPTRKGCTFAGWYTSKYGGRKIVSGDLVDWSVCELYAHWTATIQNTMGSGVSNVRVGRVDVRSDGNGVVFPTLGMAEQYWGEFIGYVTAAVTDTNNCFEVECEGEAIVSFDWVVDVDVDETAEMESVNVHRAFTIDGEEPTKLRPSYSDNYFYASYQNGQLSWTNDRSNGRRTVKAYLTPGKHVLRWTVSSCYGWGYDAQGNEFDPEMRVAVENFQIVEKPVATRETLFDWSKLVYEYLVWKPDNLTVIQNRYTQKINKNSKDYESRIWRALTKLVLLGENTQAREVIGQFGYKLSDYTLKPVGEFVGLAKTPLSNAVVDEIAPEVIKAIDSALEDLYAIPNTWTGKIVINPADYDLSIHTNSVYTEDKINIGLAEVSVMRAMLEAARASVMLAQGYDYEADYIAVSNACRDVRAKKCEWLSEVMAVAPQAGRVRNLAAMKEAKENFRTALESIKRADSCIMNRGDYETYLFEYDIADAAEIEKCRTILNQVEASLDATNVIDLTYFVDKYDTNGIVRAEIPGGEAMRQLFLGALFAGNVTRALVPEVQLDPAAVDMDSVRDFTIGGLFPDVTFSDVLGRLPFSQIWSAANYRRQGSPAVLLTGNETLTLWGTAQNDGDVSFTMAAAGTVTCSIDGEKQTPQAVSGGDAYSLSVQKGQDYEISFAPQEAITNAISPIAVTSLPEPDFPQPDWAVTTKGDSMTVYAVVKDVATDTFIDEAGSLLAAFSSDGECRGIAEIRKGPSGKLFQLSVGIESTSETGLTLKIWNAGTGEISDVNQKVEACAEKIIGAINSPTEYSIGTKKQCLSLAEGWSWISFCVVPDDPSISSIFAGCNFSDKDMLKASDRIVTYYNGRWYPADYELKPGAAYMVKRSGSGTEQVEISGLPMTDGITVASGWNWFGPTVLTSCFVENVTHTGGFADHDLVKDSSGSATWFEGIWYDGDFEIVSGVGYQAKLSNAGKLYFGSSPKLVSRVALALSARAAATATNKPNWSVVTKGDTMAVYAVVSNLTTQSVVEDAGTLLAAFDQNGECRGVAEIEEGPCGKLFQLSVGIESTSETGFSLKLWSPVVGEVVDVAESVDANALKQIGEVDEPIALTVEIEGDPSYDVIIGAKVDIDVGLSGYVAKNLPKGLSYNAKTGKVTGTAKAAGEYEVTLTKKGASDEVVKLIVRKENAPTLSCAEMEEGSFTVGVAGAAGGIPLLISAESGVKTVTAKNLPTGMKVVQDKTTKKWLITGGATKSGSFSCKLTVTTVAGTKIEREFNIVVDSLPVMAVGTFNGFVTLKNSLDQAVNRLFGSIQVTTTDAGKISAKVTTAAKTYSFSATCWDSVTDGVYSVSVAMKTGEVLYLSLNSLGGWNEHQLSGQFEFKSMPTNGGYYEISAQRNAFGKAWYFDVSGSESEGWTFTYAKDYKKAALALTLNADGKTAIAGQLGSLKVSASGFADVSGIADGGVVADFAPVVTVNKAKVLLSIRVNLWFDRSGSHDFIGAAELVR